jgi:hypothetical protein
MNKISLNFGFFTLFFAAMSWGYVLPVAADNAQLNIDMALFQRRCTQCHAIELAYNDETVLPSELLPMIQRMMDMPDSQIQQGEKFRLYQISCYHAYVYQRDPLNKKLNALSEEQKKREIEALKSALAPYKK